jgi:hypothetical protein
VHEEAGAIMDPNDGPQCLTAANLSNLR